MQSVRQRRFPHCAINWCSVSSSWTGSCLLLHATRDHSDECWSRVVGSATGAGEIIDFVLIGGVFFLVFEHNPHIS